jgi:signal transduction histidine kinase
LSNLVASVAHEINNTYGLIPDDVDELKEALPNSSEEINALLDEIKDLTMQMVYYSNEIGGYSIGKMGERRTLNINDIVKTAAQQIPEFRKPENFEKISLKLNLSEPPLQGLLHENPLIRTIRNIIINAYQALEGAQNGEIVIRTDEVKNDDEIIKTDGDSPVRMVKIEIEDNGCGIKEVYKSKIFNPEFTTKSGKGSGIGLWLAKRHLDSIGGYITFDSVENQGTIFTLGIPLNK